MFFFFNDTATTEIYTLSLHDALPITALTGTRCLLTLRKNVRPPGTAPSRSEEHTSELQSRVDPVCRLLLEKKKGPSRAKRVNRRTEEKTSEVQSIMEI